MRLAYYSAASIVFALAVWAAAWSAVELPVHFHGDLDRGWESSGSGVEPSYREQARGRLERAAAVDPADERYVLALGRIHFANALRFPVGDQPARAEREEALRYFRRATASRPAWAKGWAYVARTKMYEPDLDDEFYAALERASILGPWEPEVQDSIAWTGMATWQRLPPAMRERVRVTVRRMLDHYPRDRYAIEMAVRLHWEDELGSLALSAEQLGWLKEGLAHRSALRAGN